MKPLEDNATCVAFLAETKDDLQIVKFVDRFGRAVHEFLAERGYAPRLRYCGPLPLLQTAQPRQGFRSVHCRWLWSWTTSSLCLGIYRRLGNYWGNCIKMDKSLATCDNLTSSSTGQTKSSSSILIGQADTTDDSRLHPSPWRSSRANPCWGT